MVLLNGEREEIILREAKQLRLIANAISEAKALGASGDDLAKLEALSVQLGKKIDLPGTKAQLKPAYSKRVAGSTRKLVKLQLVFKWGGEVCVHSAQRTRTEWRFHDCSLRMRPSISLAT